MVVAQLRLLGHFAGKLPLFEFSTANAVRPSELAFLNRACVTRARSAGVRS
jgi:hypothetical protein